MWFSKKNQQVQEQQKTISNDDLTKTRDEKINAAGKIVDKIANKYLISKSNIVKMLQDFFDMSRDILLSKNSADAANSLLNEIKTEQDDNLILHNVKNNLSRFFNSSVSTDWLLNDLIRDNTTYVVSGENKIGKSLFALQLAFSFILQNSFLSDAYFWRFSRNKRVLYVTLDIENPIYVIKERIFNIADFYKLSHDDINAFFYNFELVNNIDLLFTNKIGNIEPTDSFRRLGKYIEDNGIELVIIDPAQYFFDFDVEVNENKFAKAYQYLSSIRTTFLILFNKNRLYSSFENSKYRINFNNIDSNNIEVRFFNGTNLSKKFLLPKSKYPFRIAISDNKSSNETKPLGSLLNVFEAKNIDEDKLFKPKLRDEIYNNNLSNQQETEEDIADKRFFDELNEMKADFDKHLDELNKTKAAFDKEISDSAAKIDEIIIEHSKPRPTKPKKSSNKKSQHTPTPKSGGL